MKKLLIVVVAALAIAACSSSTKSTTKSSTKPDQRVTDTNVVEKTPQSCIDALDEAEQVFHISADFAGITSRVFDTAKRAVAAAAIQDESGINDATSEVQQETSDIDDLTGKIGDITPQYNSNSADCRANH